MEEERENLIPNGERPVPKTEAPGSSGSSKYNAKYIVLFSMSLAISSFVAGYNCIDETSIYFSHRAVDSITALARL